MPRQNNNVHSDITVLQLDQYYVTTEMSALKVKFLTQIPIILRAMQQIPRSLLIFRYKELQRRFLLVKDVTRDQLGSKD